MEAIILNLKPPLKMQSMMLAYIVNGSKLGTMIGTWSGAKRNKSTGSLRSTASCLTWRSTISEDGISYAGKICSIKISRSSKEDSISKITKRSPINMTFCRPLFNCLANMSSSTNNSKSHNSTIKLYGSWNQYHPLLS